MHLTISFQLLRAEDKVELLYKIGVHESVLSDVVTHAAMQEIPDLMKKVCIKIYIIAC